MAEHTLGKGEVAGSIPVFSSKITQARIAHPIERPTCNGKATGLSPVPGSSNSSTRIGDSILHLWGRYGVDRSCDR
jgi:hypothetical protein